MIQPDKLVSVLLPVRNAEKTLAACLDSLLSQTHKSLEIIAIDDKSSDETYKILRSYRRRDKRLIISRNVKNYGMAVTLNRCLKQVKGKFVIFMNQNDTLTPDKIKRQIFYLNRHAKVVAVGTQAIFVDQERKKQKKSNFPTDHGIISKTFLHQNSLLIESLMINRYLLPKDLLKFNHEKYPMLYHSVLVKMLPYGMLANLNQHLYYRARHEQFDLDDLKNKLKPHFLLWLKARYVYGTGPSLQSLLYPFNNRTKSSV